MSNQTIYEEFKKKVGKKTIQYHTYIRTQCKDCGKIIEYPKIRQKTSKGRCRSCYNIVLSQNLTNNARDLTGHKFGHLTVILFNGYNKFKHRLWLCKCLCGCQSIVVGFKLVSGHTKSCGCARGLTQKEYIKSKVKITEDGKWLWQGFLDKDGYGRANWKGEAWRAHRLSYTSFIGDIPPSLIVCHKNDCPQDVNPKNLFLSDTVGNVKDKVRKNRQAYGSKNGYSKIDEKTAYKIKQLLIIGGTPTEIAKSIGISRNIVYGISSGKTWKYVPWPSPYSISEKLTS